MSRRGGAGTRRSADRARSRAEAAAEPMDVEVRALASSGAGVADLPDGRVAFVHGTLPGEEATVRVTRARPRWAAAALVELTQAAPERVEPPCPHFGVCGGCTLQHAGYDLQRHWKGRFVAEALARIGGVDAEPPEVAPSPEVYGYRTRIRYTLRRLRGGRVVAGFGALERPGRTVDVRDDCLLPTASLRAAWSGLREAWGPGARHLPAGGRLRLGLHEEADGPTLVVEGGEEGWDPRELVSGGDGGLRRIWHRPRGAAGPHPVWEAEPSADPVPPAFAQANAGAAAALVARVLEGAAGAETVVDAYAGAGAYAVPLAASGARVVAIEADPSACARALRDAPASLEVVQARVEDVLAGRLPADVVIVNPPRTGLDEQVVEALTAAPPGRVVYVSCDPATLARDVGRFGAGWRLARLDAFDLFPQTGHVETVAVLEPDVAPGPDGSGEAAAAGGLREPGA